MMENLEKGNEIVDRHISDYITTLDNKRSGLQKQIARAEPQAFQDTARAMDAEYLREASRSVLNAFSSRDYDNECSPLDTTKNSIYNILKFHTGALNDFG